MSEGVAEESQLFLQDACVLPNYVAKKNTANVTGDTVNRLVAFTTSMEERGRCHPLILPRTPRETIY
jgi:hypothetical protein